MRKFITILSIITFLLLSVQVLIKPSIAKSNNFFILNGMDTYVIENVFENNQPPVNEKDEKSFQYNPDNPYDVEYDPDNPYAEWEK